MRRLIRPLLYLLAILIALALVLGLTQREKITRLMAVNSLFAPDRIVSNFSHMDRLFLSVPLPRGEGPVSPLPPAAGWVAPAGFDAWVSDRKLTAIVVLKDGKLLHEAYFQGTGPEDRRISWSVAKSWLSALMGTVLAEGKIGSLDDPVDRYAPRLAGSAYQGVTIRNVLNMASGVHFNEDYFDYWSDINKMGRVLAIGGSMDGFAAGITERDRAAGAAWQYVSIDTHVLGMVIEGATGRRIADLMTERIVQPLGLEADGYYLTDSQGTAFVLGGLNFRTRDYARFGQMILQQGQWQGRQIVPADWIAASTVPSAPTAPGARRYGYQWWIPADPRPGEFYGVGHYGQYLYINRPAGVVIAVNATDRNLEGPGVMAGNIAMFRQIAAGLP